jgi:putative ABC transport system permease protein
MARRSVDLRFYANTLGLFSAIAVILSAIGISGLVNYSVTDRVHEIGIWQSLGASRRRVLWLIVSDGLKLAGVEIAIGLAGAFAATRLLQAMLFDIKRLIPATGSVSRTSSGGHPCTSGRAQPCPLSLA